MEEKMCNKTEKKYPRDSFRFVFDSSILIRQTFAHDSFTFDGEAKRRKKLNIWTLGGRRENSSMLAQRKRMKKLVLTNSEA